MRGLRTQDPAISHPLANGTVRPGSPSPYLADSNRFFPLLYFPASTATTSSRTPPTPPRPGEWGVGSGEWHRRTMPLEDASKQGLVTTPAPPHPR